MLIKLYRYRVYRYLPITVIVGIVPAWLLIHVAVMALYELRSLIGLA